MHIKKHFVFRDPTAYESDLMPFKWLTFSNKNPNYLSIGHDVKMDKQLFENGFQFWNEIYDKHNWSPKPPKIVVEEPIKKTEDKKLENNKPTGEKATKKSDGESSKKVDIPDASEDRKGKTAHVSDQGTKEDEKTNTVYVNDPMKSRVRKENTAAQDSKETEQPSSKTHKIKPEL